MHFLSMKLGFGHLSQRVQVGDQLDRGDNEIQILYFLERLQKEAAAAGGALHILNGNHETMNVAGRFRYATTPGRIAFLRWQLLQSIGAGLKVILLRFCITRAVLLVLVLSQEVLQLFALSCLRASTGLRCARATGPLPAVASSAAAA